MKSFCNWETKRVLLETRGAIHDQTKVRVRARAYNALSGNSKVVISFLMNSIQDLPVPRKFQTRELRVRFRGFETPREVEEFDEVLEMSPVRLIHLGVLSQ